MTQTQTVPPRPDVVPGVVAPPAPKKWPWWKIALAIVGALVVLDVAGSLLNPADTPTTTTTAPTTTTRTEAEAQAIPLIDSAQAELSAITATSDISADVAHLRSIADTYDEISALFVGVDDDTAGYFASAADHTRVLAVAWESGDLDTIDRESAAITDALDAAAVDS